VLDGEFVLRQAAIMEPMMALEDARAGAAPSRKSARCIGRLSDRSPQGTIVTGSGL
jgi:hypothetical protein